MLRRNHGTFALSGWKTQWLPRTDHDLRLHLCRDMQEGPTGTNIVKCLQLIAHLDREALNVALNVALPGVLLKTLSAHYASTGRLAKYKRQFERMTRPPGG